MKEYYTPRPNKLKTIRPKITLRLYSEVNDIHVTDVNRQTNRESGLRFPDKKRLAFRNLSCMEYDIRMPWTENKEWAWYFAQTNRALKGQDSRLNI